MQITKSLNDTDIQIATNSRLNTYVTTKPKKKNRRLKKGIDHPYNLKRENIKLRRAEEIKKKKIKKML